MADSLAMVTDYDCWHEGHDDVTVELLLGNLRHNAESASRLVRALVAILPTERTCGCGDALATALITRAEAIPAATRRRLGPLIDRHLEG